MDAQRKYLGLVKSDLVALATGAVAGAIVLPAGLAGQAIAAVAALALIIALIITLQIQARSYERTWYGGRAVAESAKTLAWRYMVRAEPFDDTRSADADALFAARLKELLKDSVTLNVRLSSSEGDQITNEMRQARAASLAERRDLYAECRIRDQQRWYTARARSSEKAGRRLFVAIWVINVLAVTAAICMIIRPTSTLNGTGVLATVAAALFAWLQVRRHQELAQSYAVAEQDLAAVHSTAAGISSEHAFAVFVADAEAAISREHILWVARRDAGIRVTGLEH